MDPVSSKIDTLAEALRQTVTGRYALAIAGSHAKGTADAHSDIDFFLYAEQPRPYEERKRCIDSLADAGTPRWVSPDFRDGAWGGSMDFTYQGTPVETTVKLLEDFESQFSRCLQGDFDIIPADWTTNGYFSYICLSEIHFVKPVADPFHILADYKSRCAAYPPLLQRAIAERFMGRSCFWLDSFHYLSAIEREDVLFTAPIVQHITLDLIQVVFALHEVYFTGDKKLVSQLQRLPRCPRVFLEHIEELMSSPKDRDHLRRQREILCQTRAALEEQIAGLAWNMEGR